MSVSVEKLEGGMAKLTIEVSPERLEEALEKAYRKNRDRIQIQGFRKGKVPRFMVEKLYGPEVFYEEAANDIIPEAYEEAVKDCGEDVVSDPKIDVEQIEKGSPFIFTAEVALKPEIKLGKYKGIKVTKQTVEVTEAELERKINEELERNARILPVTDRPVENGDTISLDFEGFVDGEPFEGGKGVDYSLVIGSGTFIPGFEDKLIGAEAGQELDVEVTFPEDYHSKELAGKPAVFKCRVNEIRRKEIPALDQEYIEDVSEFETVDEYKEDIRKKLLKSKEDTAKAFKEDEAIKALIDDSLVDLPEAMVETHAKRLVRQYERNAMMQGIPVAQYYQYSGLTPEKLLDNMRPQAEVSIKSRLALEAVVKAEDIQVSEEEIEAEVEKRAGSFYMDKEEYKKLLGEDGLKELKDDVAVEKAVDFILKEAKEVKETKKTAKKGASSAEGEAENAEKEDKE